MSKKYSDELTPSQIKELEEIMGELTDTAKEVVDDFEKNPSKLNSGSAVQIHSESPYLDSHDDTTPLFKDDKWKKVIKNTLPPPPIKIKKKSKK